MPPNKRFRIVVKEAFEPIRFPRGHFSQHVQKLGVKMLDKVFEAAEEDGVIRAKCKSQMSSTAIYKLTFEMDEFRRVKKAFCSCKAGVAGTCKHSFALFKKINQDKICSVTSQPQKWSKPAKKEWISGKRLLGENGIIPAKPIIRKKAKVDIEQLVNKHLLSINSGAIKYHKLEHNID